MECLSGDPALEEEFKRFKKRDLTETYSFKMACDSLGPQKCKNIVFRSHMMDRLSTVPKTRAQPRQFSALPHTPATNSADLQVLTCYPENKLVDLPEWIRDRKALREVLDGMGDLRRWLHNKPNLTDLEFRVMEREGRARISPPETSMYTPDAATSSPSMLKHEIEEVNQYLCMHKHTCKLAKLLDWHGTGQIKRADLCTLFEKEGFFIPPERLDELIFSLNSQDGTSVAVDDLAAGIQAWSRKYQERDGQRSNPMLEFKHNPQKDGIMLDRGDQDQEGMKDAEVLAIMRRVLASTKTSCPSSLSGPMGREVNRFRGLCFKQYAKALEQCQQRGLNVSQATLQRAMLHPGDMSISRSSNLGGKGNFTGRSRREQRLASLSTPKAHQVEYVPHKSYKEVNKKSIGWADPNAFWPGREDHVRLFLPLMPWSPASVLFQCIEHSSAPSSGSWPINHLGYSTSGDIEACKKYTL
ncbi:EF-hand calcium-binding domain-containing protein 12 isoform X1 [Paramisgurnus dabryanus]|uniref:EF-hand calcium-binding domain-containing protein 12 isoform X1 n=1 Tax=Paramisgurnus dabryanus TaxID=90735 RepID=UPI0031F3D61B